MTLRSSHALKAQAERDPLAPVHEDLWMAQRHATGMVRGLPPRANVVASLCSKYIVYPELRHEIAPALRVLGAPLPDVSPRELVLVGCGKAKRSVPSPASDLYTGTLFRAALAYAHARFGEIAIVSARYGLVVPWRTLEPYDFTITKLDALAQDAWAKDVVEHLSVLAGFSLPYRVTLLMGEAYAAPLRANLARDERCIEVREPLRGLPLGARLRWLTKESEGATRRLAAQLALLA
jgi:hypothetical protein